MTDGKSGEQISPQAWMLKGQALADLGETSAASQCLRKAAICCRDEDTDTMLSLARLQFEFGDFVEARNCLGRAFRQDPYNPAALQMQAMLDRSSTLAQPAKLVGYAQPAAATQPSESLKN